MDRSDRPEHSIDSDVGVGVRVVGVVLVVPVMVMVMVQVEKVAVFQSLQTQKQFPRQAEQELEMVTSQCMHVHENPVSFWDRKFLLY